MRNILAKATHKNKEAFVCRLKQIWLQPDRETAIAYCREVVEQYADILPEAISILEDGLEDSLSYIRLICSYLIEYEEDWQTGRSYITAESLAKQQALLNMAA